MTDWSITIHFSYVQFCLLNLRYGLTIAFAKNLNTYLNVLLRNIVPPILGFIHKRVENKEATYLPWRTLSGPLHFQN